jgi:hypothetical protein
MPNSISSTVSRLCRRLGLPKGASLHVLRHSHVNMAGCTPGAFVYTALGSPVTLTAGANYYLASQEVNGGDSWFDHGSLTSTAAGQVSSSVYLFNGAWQTIDGPNTSYVPANFLYQIAP